MELTILNYVRQVIIHFTYIFSFNSENWVCKQAITIIEVAHLKRPSQNWHRGPVQPLSHTQVSFSHIPFSHCPTLHWTVSDCKSASTEHIWSQTTKYKANKTLRVILDMLFPAHFLYNTEASGWNLLWQKGRKVYICQQRW